MDIQSLLGADAESLLGHESKTISKDQLHLPGPDFVDRIFAQSDRSPQVLRSLQQLFDHGRLGGSGYVSILPVDQGIEHTAAASFAPNPAYFDPENIVKLAIEGGCNAVASTVGVLGAVDVAQVRAQDPVHREDQPQRVPDATRTSVRPDHVRLGAAGLRPRRRRASARRSTSAPTSRAARSSGDRDARLRGGPQASGCSPSCGATCATDAFKVDGVDYHDSADVTAQANHLGATIQADIVKQKLPTKNGGFNAIKFAKTSPLVYSELATDHPIDLCRWQVANGFMGRVGLINSGGESNGASDLADAVTTAVINKRAGGTGLISGRKAFQKPMAEGVELLNAIQDVYLDAGITVA